MQMKLGIFGKNKNRIYWYTVKRRCWNDNNAIRIDAASEWNVLVQFVYVPFASIARFTLQIPPLYGMSTYIPYTFQTINDLFMHSSLCHNHTLLNLSQDCRIEGDTSPILIIPPTGYHILGLNLLYQPL